MRTRLFILSTALVVALAGCGTTDMEYVNKETNEKITETQEMDEMENTEEAMEENKETVRNTTTPQPTPVPIQQKTVSQTPLSELMVVSIQKDGFKPQNATARIGQRVIYVNDTESTSWPFSVNYPKFDAGRTLNPGEAYAIEFEEPMTISISDKLRSIPAGTLTVK